MENKKTFLIWITGLAGSGKTTIGKEVYNKLKKQYNNTFFLDGDTFREIFGGNLGYDLKSRFETALKISNFCKVLVEQDINVVCSTISLFKEIHKKNTTDFKNYFEIFLDVDFEELKIRDQKGIYSKALAGEINNVIGVDLPYDIPEKPSLVINNNNKDKLDEKVLKILNLVNF